MKINIKELIISIVIPVFLGFIGGLFTSSFNKYEIMIQPNFAPPRIVFPIVWTILYTLMGISSYIIYTSNSYDKDSALFLYYVQLIINLLWSFFFFTFKFYLFSFLWILLLMIAVILMIIKFYSISKISAILQIPYLLWLIFASILNFSIFLLN